MANVFEIKSGLDLESSRIARSVADQDEFSTVIINASLDGILAYDRECRYTLWSPSMERMTGFKSSQVLGRCAFEMFPFLKEVGIDRQYARSLNGESVRSPIIRYEIPETGAHGYSEQQNFPLFNEDGVVTGGMAIIRDVTEIRGRFESMAKKNRELEARVLELEMRLRRSI